MSPDQISENPLPPGKKRCPHCGEEMSSSAEICWLCLENAAAQSGKPARHEQSSQTPTEDRVTWVVFGVLTISLAAGTAFESPGTLVVVLFLMTPVFVRIIVNWRARRVQKLRHALTWDPAAAPMEPKGCLLFVVSSVMAVVALASIAAFLSACKLW